MMRFAPPRAVSAPALAKLSGRGLHTRAERSYSLTGTSVAEQSASPWLLVPSRSPFARRTEMLVSRPLAVTAAADSASSSSWIVAGLALAIALVLVLMLAVNLRGRRRLAVAAEKLAASEARLRELAETVPAGIFQTDAQGRRVFVNPRLADISGDADPEAIKDRPWLIHEDDESRVMTEWADAAVESSSMTTKFRIRRHDGEVRWVSVEARPLLDDNSAITGWVGSVVDITEETVAIADLRRFGEILEATPDLVAMVDTDGRFTYANAAARARFGIDSDEKMQSLRAVDVYAPGSRTLFFGEAVPTANRLGVWTGEVDLLLPDGTELPVSQVVVAHRRPDGSIDYYSSI